MILNKLLHIFIANFLISKLNGSDNLLDFRIQASIMYEPKQGEKSHLIYEVDDWLSNFKSYNGSFKELERTKFKTIKILHIDYDRFKNHKSYQAKKQFSITMKMNKFFKKIEKNKFKPMSYEEKKALQKHLVKCQWNVCNFDTSIININSDKYKINEKILIQPFDFVILVLLKSKTNRISFETIPYHEEMFFVHGCPTKNYVSNTSYTEYIVDKHVEENGVLHPDKFESHRIIPIVPKKPNDEFFVCGKLKQPTLPDLVFGFKLISSLEKVMGLAENKYPNASKNPCKNIHTNFTFSFFYLHNIYHVDGINSVENRKKHSIYYYGSKIYTFDIYKFKKENILKNLDVIIGTPPKCIHNIGYYRGNMSSFFDNYQSTVNEHLNMTYIHVNENFYNKKIWFVCEIKNMVVRYVQISLGKAFRGQRVCKILSLNKEKCGIKHLSFSNNTIEPFGEYYCRIIKKSKMITNETFKEYSIYYIPEKNKTFTFPDKNIAYNNISYPSCEKSLFTYAIIKTMKVFIDSKEIASYSNISMDKNRFFISNNFIQFKPNPPSPKLTVFCTYETVAETIFNTEQTFQIIGIPKIFITTMAKSSTTTTTTTTTRPATTTTTTTTTTRPSTTTTTTTTTTRPATTTTTTTTTTRPSTTTTTTTTTTRPSTTTTTTTTKTKSIFTITTKTEISNLITTKVPTKSMSIKKTTQKLISKQATTTSSKRKLKQNLSTKPLIIIGPPKEKPIIILQNRREYHGRNTFIWTTLSIFILVFFILVLTIFNKIKKERQKDLKMEQNKIKLKTLSHTISSESS